VAPRAFTPFVALVAAACLLPAAASAALGDGSFSVSPQPKPGQARAYFDLTLSAGETHRDAVVVANDSKQTLTLAIGASRGATAAGSGVAYLGAYAPCTGTACWIRGLPSTLTLAPKQHKTLPFTVMVPAGAPLKQYLAGITVQPAKQPSPTTLGTQGGTSAQAIIIHQVNVGVSVTVGVLSQLSSQLTVLGITGSSVGTTPRLIVHERNTGQTYTHAKGTATCTSGAKTFTFPVYSDTVLPGDRADLTTNAPGLPSGKSVHCTVQLAYERGQSSAHAEVVKIPTIKKVKIVHTGPGVYSEVPAPPGMPTWAYVLIGLGGAVLLALLVVAVLLLRRRTPAPAPVAPDEAPPESPGAPEAD